MVHVNGKKVGGNANISKFTAYVSPYFVVSNGGAYTKHIYAASQRIASKLGNIDGFGADPRRVEQAGGKKYDDKQSETIKARFEALHIDYSDGNGKKDDEEYEPTMDSEEKENLVFFYHPDHLGSTSYVTDADGNIAQHVEYIPYGEVFVEERNNSFSTNYLFNAKELDNETGLYYYGARYLDPTGAMWLSVDPVFHAGTSPYAYCLGNPVKMVDPDGRVETYYNIKGKEIGKGTNSDDNSKYVIRDKNDIKLLNNSKKETDLASLKSAYKLPSDNVLKETYDVLKRSCSSDNRGKKEESSLVYFNGHVEKGKPGEEWTDENTIPRGSLPKVDGSDSDVEASIHSHPYIIIGSHFSSADYTGIDDPSVFSRFKINIIVGKGDGDVSRIEDPINGTRIYDGRNFGAAFLDLM